MFDVRGIDERLNYVTVQLCGEKTARGNRREFIVWTLEENSYGSSELKFGIIIWRRLLQLKILLDLLYQNRHDSLAVLLKTANWSSDESPPVFSAQQLVGWVSLKTLLYLRPKMKTSVIQVFRRWIWWTCLVLISMLQGCIYFFFSLFFSLFCSCCDQCCMTCTQTMHFLCMLEMQSLLAIV